MYALIPVFAILGVAAGTQLTLLPYAYLADPLPVYHQSQDTRIGAHAYSYAGGPSAKEEVRGLDGITRGSYSYLDANGILQSVFYVADEDGFRVAATNLPTDGDLPYETGEVLLAKNAHLEEYAKATKEHASRRKRSLEAAADQDRRPENQVSSSQADQADQDPANASSKNSHEPPASEKKTHGGQLHAGTTQSIVAPVYGFLDSILIPKLGAGIATSHQSRIDIHNNLRLKTGEPIKAVGVLPELTYETVILPGQIPLATSHQSRVQIHDNIHTRTPEAIKDPQPVLLQPTVKLETLPVISALPNYHENRIQLYKKLGLEGPNRKDTVKINAEKVAIVQTPISMVPVTSLVTKEALPVAISNQSKTQIHRNTKLEIAVPVVKESAVYLATPYVEPIITDLWPILAPIAQSSQYRTQIHSNEKIEITK